MGLADIAAEGNAMKTAHVLYETWGHLEPVAGKVYPGRILFTHGTYGDITVIDLTFDGFAGGPFFYAAVHEFVGEQVEKRRIEAGWVYEWSGKMRLFKTGRHCFSGKLRPMRVVHRFGRRT